MVRSDSIAPHDPARQTLAARVGVGIGIGIGIENSRGRTGFDPDTPWQLRVFPSRAPRPGGATDSPLLHTPDSNSPLERIPHARFAQDAKTPRQARNGIRSSSLPHFASLRLCVSQSDPPRASRFHPSPLTSEQVHHRHETYPNGIPPTAPSRLRVSPFGLNPGRMAAKITESRKRTLFPSDKAADPTRPHRTRGSPGKPSPHASVSVSGSASVSKTHGEEPGSIPIHLGSFGSSQAVPPGPEGRQMIAQRVSAGFRPPMKTSPGGATDPIHPHEHQHPLPSPTPDTAPEHESEKPQTGVLSSPNNGPTATPFFASSRLRVSHICRGMKSHAKPR
jgi:hypothetical protein